MATFLIVFREALEVVALLSLLLGVCAAGRRLWALVIGGVATGVAMSAFGAWALAATGMLGAESWEGVVLLVTAGVLTYAIFSSGRICRDKSWPVFLLTALCVVREGVETVLFLTAASTVTTVSWIGAVAGVAAALGSGFLLRKLGQRFPVQRVFAVSAGTLVLLAAWFSAAGVAELQEAGVLGVWHSLGDEISVASFATGAAYLLGVGFLWWRQVFRKI